MVVNETILRFGYPGSLIAETEFWAILLRPKQITAACTVLACKESATSIGQISELAIRELPLMCKQLEAAIVRAYSAEKFNYLALMMIDPHVHFHVIPRYSKPVKIDNEVEILDPGWPKLPDMAAVNELSKKQALLIKNAIKQAM